MNAIAPDYMKTDMTKLVFAAGGELAHVLDMVQIKRLGEPHELCGLAIYLASEAFPFVTGSRLSSMRVIQYGKQKGSWINIHLPFCYIRRSAVMISTLCAFNLLA